ncbi:DUF1294 domain-containing protein [Bacillus sp. M6-12]|nr:DUF1294 domain-containing protein [Bacillus sp. M6-12]
MNLYGYFIMYSDKERAKAGQYRIPEATLWKVTLIGGAIGTWLGMKSFKHKTKHATFKFGFTAIAVLEIILVIYMIFS